MIKAYFWSKKWCMWAYGCGALLLGFLYTQVYMVVLLNTWRRDFFDLFETIKTHTPGEFWGSLWRFTWIAMFYVFCAIITSYLTRLYSLRWREAMTFEYIPRWREVREEIEGASQRIQEDTYRFAKIVEYLGLQIVNAFMTLVAFLPILWSLSYGISVPIIQDVPGSLVWAALITSIGGMIISWLVGIKLPGLEYNNQKVEAAFRKELVYGEDDKVNFAAIPTLTALFTGIRSNSHRLFLHYGYFDLWFHVYNQFMYIMPFLFIGPNLFANVVTLGIVMQIVDAFSQVHNSFSLFIYNWTTVTELRSIRRRLREFEANLDKHSSPRRRHPGLTTMPAVRSVGENPSGGSDVTAGGMAGAMDH
jgi:peptide/bleomycin uptake transporter